MTLQKFIAKNLKIRTKAVYALLNNFKTGKLTTEPPSCISSAFIQNSTRSITSLVSITVFETAGADFARPESCFTLQNNGATCFQDLLTSVWAILSFHDGTNS